MTDPGHPPPIVIEYRLISWWWSPAMFVFLTSVFVMVCHRVVLRCERPASEEAFCQSLDEHVAWTSPSERIALSTISGARLVSGTGKSRTSYVALVTGRGLTPLSGGAESGDMDEKQTMVRDFNAFLADPSATHFASAYGSPWEALLWEILVVVPVAAILARIAGLVRVIVDRAAARVSVQRSRFPLSLSYAQQDYELVDVCGAEVTESRSTKGGMTYGLALILKDGRRVPLTWGFSGGRGGKQRVAERIAQALDPPS
jgi:hypothetical protein